MPHFPISLIVLALTSASARATELTPTPAEVITTSRVGVGFGELKILESSVEPGFEGRPPEAHAVARTQPMGWRLFIGLKPVAPAAEGPNAGYFMLRLPLSSEHTQVSYYLIGPEGEISHGVLSIAIGSQDWERLRDGPAVAALKSVDPAHASYFHLGVATTYLSFAQSDLASYSQLALAAQGSARLPFARNRARASLNASVTLFPFIKSDGISARMLDLDAQVRYGWPLGPTARWSLYLNGGVYFRTMFVTADALGYHGIAGPLLYPSVRRTWSGGGSAGAYVKLSPITDGLSFLSLANHELTLGADWAMVLRNRHFLTLNADVSAFRMTFADVEMSSLTVALGVKYGL